MAYILTQTKICNKMRKKTKEQILFLLFILLLVSLNFPILSLIQSDQYIGGFPLKIVLIFIIWLVIILAAAFFVNRKK